MSAIYRSPEAGAQVSAAYLSLLSAWPIPSRQLTVPTREGETFVLICGPADAPPLILLHGAQANAAAWMFEAPSWSQGFCIYAIDMIGEPGLSAPSRPPLASDAHALWLNDVMAHLGVDRAAFVGVSLGGWLALDYAVRNPGRVERLALLCPAGIGRQKNFLLKALPLLLLGPWGARKVREMVFGPQPKDIPPPLKPFVQLMSLIGRSVRPRLVKIPQLSDAQLQALDMPLLVIVGGKDVLIDSNETRRRMAQVKNAEVQFLPQARHFIPGQSAAILDFLRKPHESGARFSQIKP